MSRNKNTKYKKSFDSFIRQILDVGSDEDESLEEGVAVASSEEESTGDSEHASDAESSSGCTFSITPDETYTISGGRVVHCCAEEPPAVRPQPVFCTSEQLKTLRLHDTPSAEPDTKGIIDPSTKFRKKKPTKRCANLDGF